MKPRRGFSDEKEPVRGDHAHRCETLDGRKECAALPEPMISVIVEGGTKGEERLLIYELNKSYDVLPSLTSDPGSTTCFFTPAHRRVSWYQ